MDLQIEDYLDGRLQGPEREQFEARIKEDKELRAKVETATQSVELIRKALVAVSPSGDFEEKVSSQIISITQSNQSIRPLARSRISGPLTSTDPDADLLDDPDANAEKRRLKVIAAFAAVLFAAALAAIIAILISNHG